MITEDTIPMNSILETIADCIDLETVTNPIVVYEYMKQVETLQAYCTLTHFQTQQDKNDYALQQLEQLNNSYQIQQYDTLDIQQLLEQVLT